MKNRILQNGNINPNGNQGHGGSVGVNDLAEKLLNMTPERRKVAEKFIAFLHGVATGRESQFDYFSDLLPGVLAFTRNDKYRFAGALRKSARIFRNTRSDLTDKLLFWADRIHLLAWNCKRPADIRWIICSCVPSGSQNN